MQVFETTLSPILYLVMDRATRHMLLHIRCLVQSKFNVHT